MVKFTTSDWHRYTIFFRVDVCQLVNSKMEIKKISPNFDLRHFGTATTISVIVFSGELFISFMSIIYLIEIFI